MWAGVYALIYAAALTAVFCVCELARWKLSAKLLVKHQTEWNEIKKNLAENEIDDAYVGYIGELIANRDSFLGACLPKE